MIEFTKLFLLLKERGMKKTDLLEIMSPQTLSKLGKNAVIKSDIIDKIWLFLQVQPNEIMEVYEYAEIDGKKYKVKSRDISGTVHDITYGKGTLGTKGLTLSDLRKVVTKEGYIDVEILDSLLRKAEEDK